MYGIIFTIQKKVQGYCYPCCYFHVMLPFVLFLRFQLYDRRGMLSSLAPFVIDLFYLVFYIYLRNSPIVLNLSLSAR